MAAGEAFVACWDALTGEWQTISGTMVGPVYALTVYDGRLVAGGPFSIIDGQSAERVARWDGVAWSSLGDGITPGSVVRALTVYDGELVATGQLYFQNGHAYWPVVRWDGSAWQSMSGVTGFLQGYVLGSYRGDLILGGEEAALSEPRVLRWDGHDWYTLGTGAGYTGPPWNGPVRALAVREEAEGPALYVAGELISFEGIDTTNVLRWDGSAWSAVGAGRDSDVYTLAVYQGSLVAGGPMRPGSSMAVWNGATRLPPTNGFDGLVRTAIAYNGDWVVGGVFAAGGGTFAKSIVKWDGAALSPIGGDLTFDSQGVPWPASVNALMEHDGCLVAGGDFTHAAGVAAHGIACWDGSVWQPIGEDTHFWDSRSEIRALASFEGDLVAAGSFEDENGYVANIARWDGVSWSPDDAPMIDLDYVAECHGTLLVGAEAQGIMWRGSVEWHELEGAPQWVNYMTTHEGDLLVDGWFETEEGWEKRIVRWDGAEWHSFCDTPPGDATVCGV